MSNKGYSSDSSDEEWAFVLPYLTLMSKDAPQRKHDLRRVFDALKYVVRLGIDWRYLPSDFPPWAAVYQQARREIDAGMFEATAHDLREIMRYGQARKKTPSGAVLDARVLKFSNRRRYPGKARADRSRTP
jgi:transposase